PRTVELLRLHANDDRPPLQDRRTETEEQRLFAWIPAQRLDVETAVVGQILRRLLEGTHVLDQPGPEVGNDFRAQRIAGPDRDPKDRFARCVNLAALRLLAMRLLAFLQPERGRGKDELPAHKPDHP